MQSEAVHARYADDKPQNCDYCYFQSPVKRTCELDECFYMLPETGEIQEGCACCPYNRNRPCIGFCIRKLLAEVQAEKSRKGGGVGAG